MTRPDLFDYIGGALIVLVVALWVAHIVLPAPPPEPPQPGAVPQALPFPR